MDATTGRDSAADIDSAYAWRRLACTGLISTIGGVGMWSFIVALPTVQADFGISRADASMPYTWLMLGFGVGGIFMGKLADRRGIVLPLLIAITSLGAGYVLCAFTTSIWQLALVHGVLLGLFGTSVMFAPLLADISHWFVRRRGIAIAVTASGNYIAGTIWPPILQNMIASFGWRHTFIAVGAICVVTMLPLVLGMRRRPVFHAGGQAAASATTAQGSLGLSPNTLTVLLWIAGLACCTAMAMPQVHIVAYCGDLGYGVARGAEMLSLMLGFGVVSRIAFGFISDRIGGLPTLLVGSVLQTLVLVLYLGFSGLTSLYVVSALFGLVQGGIVPAYALIVREYFPPQEAGSRVGIVIMSTLVGMAFGGWVSGAIFDATGSYLAAFAHGAAWNVINAGIAAFLLMRARGSGSGRLVPA
jgi:MFS family permease